MFNKLVVLLAAALAVTAQAGHVKHHHVRRHYGSVPQNSTSVAPQSTPSASPVPISSGTAPVGSGSSASPSLLSSSTSLSASLLPSSSNPPSRSPSTAPSASLFPSSSIPLGTAPGVPPFPVSSGSLSASQNPSSTVPLGTGVTGAPAKVSLVTSDSVLTYTIGTGSSTTVIVTTVKHTRTSTIVKTIFATKPSSGELAATNVPESPGLPPRPTSTRHIYVTSTAVITVYPVASETPTGSEKGTEAQNHVKAIGSVCAAQVTVTVPGPEVTVTVTATPSVAKPSGDGEESIKAPTTTSSGAGEGGVKAPTASALPSLSSSALFNNGTEADTRVSKSKSKTKCRSTGFKTRTSAAFTAQPSATGIYNS